MSHEHHQEETLSPGLDRRSFLKRAGFSFAGAFVAGCSRGNLEKAIPFLVQPEELTPGLVYWYATTCAGCNAGCGVMAKCRDGRPIKLEGNPAHPLSRGGLCAVGQASLLGVYDSHRLKNPLINGQEATWEQIDANVKRALARIKQEGGAVRFLTGTITSPTARALIQEFLNGFTDARHIEYDAISCSAILDAHAATHGMRVLPRYRFERASVIVGFDADFLGNWISPVEFTKGYRAGRTLQGNPPRCSHHVQFESRVSLTGSNADERVCVSPAELEQCLRRLAQLLAETTGKTLPGSVSLPQALEHRIAGIAQRILQAQGRSLVVCGVNSRSHQLLVNAINEMAGAYGQTIDIHHPSHQYNGNDTELIRLLEEITAGSVAALFVAGANPIADLPDGESLAEALKKIPLLVSFAERLDETASVAGYVCPQPHVLEGWMDYQVVDGLVAVAQPTISPLMNTRHLTESLSAWMGKNASALDLIRREWERTVFTRQSEEPSFDAFWNKTLERGCAEVKPVGIAPVGFRYASLTNVLGERTSRSVEHSEYTLLLYPSLSMLDGRHAHNPWLHELPDPVTKVVWDNTVSLSRQTARRLGVVDGDMVRIQLNEKVLELPVIIQPGQHDAVVVAALGYGRKGTERFTDIGPSWLQAKPTVPPGERVGKNVAPLMRFSDGNLDYMAGGVSLHATGAKHLLAKTQEYDLLDDPQLFGARKVKRPLVQQATLEAYTKDRAAGSFPKEQLDSMWPDDHKYTGYHWGMVIDLSACTGCSACVVACQAENNIPVVGKDEVRRNREMAWIRIDRYYDDEGENFSVAHQPMLCQHCANAPCETVCPVLATVHNEEGLNQQIYNRCVGTRYCSNNCPYKVRRFNWFQYRRGDEMHKMVLNPDVTVRDRGVMEKCSFCVQRIQLAKIEARKEGRRIRDGEIQPACAQSCPAQAIVFGDMNDPTSEIAQRMNDPRYYRVLENLGVRPAVGYMTVVRDRAEGGQEVHHG